MIFSNGTNGLIGSRLKKSVIEVSGSLEDGCQLRHLSQMNLEGKTFIHLAGIVGEHRVTKDLQYSEKVNVTSSYEIAEITRHRKVGKFIYVSTSHVYAPSDSTLLESSSLNPSSRYGDQKLRAENEITNVFSDCPEQLCIVRVFSILDWGMPKESFGGAVTRLLENPVEEVINNADAVRDFLTPLTVAQTLLEIANQKKVFGIYNLCSGKSRTLREAAVHMGELSGIKLQDSNFLNSSGSPSLMLGSNQKLVSILPGLELDWKVYKIT